MSVRKFIRRAFDTLERFLRRLFRLEEDPDPVPDYASPVTHFRIEVDEMKNARFSWTFPTTRQQGGPLDPADIIGTEISIRVVGIPDWTPLGVAEPDELEFVQNELDNGDYEARAVVLTDDAAVPQRGLESILSFTVADDSPAAAVGSFAVELT